MKKRIISLFLAMVLLVAVCPTVFAAGSRSFRVNSSITLDQNGLPVISWTDSADRGPYTVSYEYTAETMGRKTRWRAASKLSAKSCTVKYLFPGETYNFYVADRNGDEASIRLTVPSNASELRPGEGTVKRFGDEVKAPSSKSSYLSHFETRYVKSRKGHSIYTFMDTKGTKRGNYYFLPEATEVLALAEEKDFTCILFTTKDGKLHIGWVSSPLLVYEYS